LSRESSQDFELKKNKALLREPENPVRREVGVKGSLNNKGVKKDINRRATERTVERGNELISY